MGPPEVLEYSTLTQSCTQVIVIGILLTTVQLCHKLLHRYGLSRLRSSFYEDFDQTLIVVCDMYNELHLSVL